MIYSQSNKNIIYTCIKKSHTYRYVLYTHRYVEIYSISKHAFTHVCREPCEKVGPEKGQGSHEHDPYWKHQRQRLYHFVIHLCKCVYMYIIHIKGWAYWWATPEMSGRGVLTFLLHCHVLTSVGHCNTPGCMCLHTHLSFTEKDGHTRQKHQPYWKQ